MIHRRMGCLKKLLSLSQIHLKLVLEERWEDWDAVADQKKDLYKRLMALRGPSVSSEERVIIDAIRGTEEKTSEELIRRRAETRKELVEIDRYTGGIKNYRQSHHKSSKRHFIIKI